MELKSNKIIVFLSFILYCITLFSVVKNKNGFLSKYDESFHGLFIVLALIGCFIFALLYVLIPDNEFVFTHKSASTYMLLLNAIGLLLILCVIVSSIIGILWVIYRYVPSPTIFTLSILFGICLVSTNCEVRTISIYK